MPHRRWALIATLVVLASVPAVAGCDAEQPRVLLSRSTATPAAGATAAPTVEATATRTAAPTATATRVSTPPPTSTPTTVPGRAVTPVAAPTTAAVPRTPTPTAAPPPPVPPTVVPRSHVVRYGETLATIAAKYGTTVTAIAQLNHLTNINRIYPGQLLLIP